nr:MAG TPA: hypothetical protein [Caudoviricetes sp.]
MEWLMRPISEDLETLSISFGRIYSQFYKKSELLLLKCSGRYGKLYKKCD